jgi:adenine-specific DNA methylase
MSNDSIPRLIEADFPLRKVSEESVREKNIRHGHISTLHIWWARRPLAASRATALAALLPDDPSLRQALLRLVRDLAPWKGVQMYGMPTWGDLFNPRQKLALITFAEKVRQAHAKILAQGAEPEFAKAVTTYLALGISRLADRSSVLCRVIPQTEAIGFTFTRQALPMLWDYIEMNPLTHPSGWSALLEDSISNIAHLTCIPSGEEEK